ncbi:esterase-like activity of phytase family protein [Actinophytocola sediminis]
MKRRSIAALSVAAAAVSTVVTPGVAAAAPVEVPGYTFRVLGERFLAEHTTFGGTRVGDLSGIDYDATNDEWYLVSDESTRRAPARFYTADLAVDTDGFHGVTVNSVSALRQADGTAFPEARRNETGSVDPEAIRVDRADGSLLWASEGRRDVPSWGRPTLIDPAVRDAGADGVLLAKHPTAPHHAASAGRQGPRDDRGFESLTLSASGTQAISATEGPLLQDGAEPTRTTGAPVRLNFANRTTGTVASQLAYELDPVPAGACDNGLSEILARDASRLLTVERATLLRGGHSVRLFEASTAGARTVLPLAALDGATYTPVSKRELLNLADLGLSRVGNIEGIAWGPTLPSGERTLILVSDNDGDGRTQLIALAVTLS